MSSLGDRRALLERKVALKRELLRRRARETQACEGGLYEFVRYFWHVLEPKTRFVDGWAMRAICEHLEAVTAGRITRLLINVPPGFSKSLLVNVFWPAWEWGPMGLPHLRTISFSYAAHLTHRDNGRFRDLVTSRAYRNLWGDVFSTTSVGVEKISNNCTGWRFATSVLGVGTGERGDRVCLDDPHNIAEGESDVKRTRTVRWFDEAMSNRLNDLEKSAIVVIMQRVNEADVSGHIIDKEDYCHLLIPMELDGHRPPNAIGWQDPRIEIGDLAWPERFSDKALTKFRANAFMWSSQYQQTPEPRGGGMFRRDWWRMYPLPVGKSAPPFEYIIASLDSAYTKQERNDPSGFTVWGVFFDRTGNPCIMLIQAWRRHLEIHGETVDRLPGETERDWQRRSRDKWGLVEWVAYDCKRLGVHRLIIEAKASGLSVAQEMQRLYRGHGFSVTLENPEGDKYARAIAIAHLFTDGLIHVPAELDDPNDETSGLVPRQFGQTLIDEMAVFPNGRYRDLTDSTTQAFKHLRAMGLAVRRGEREEERIAASIHLPPAQPLYEV